MQIFTIILFLYNIPLLFINQWKKKNKLELIVRRNSTNDRILFTNKFFNRIEQNACLLIIRPFYTDYISKKNTRKNKLAVIARRNWTQQMSSSIN